jgi:catechol 2,3-dioxygenase-like lactoylglutathione lyase family enzyme
MEGRIQIDHVIVPATDKDVSARFLGDVLGLAPERPMGHFQPLRVGGTTLDFDDATDIRPMHIAFLVDDETFDACYQRLLERGSSIYADPGRRQPGHINQRHGGRGVYFDDPDGHLFELLTAPYE